MNIQQEVTALLQAAASLSLDHIEERIAYSLLLDSLLTIAQEGWIDKHFIEMILQQWVKAFEQLAKHNVRFDLKRLEVAKQLAESYSLDNLLP